MKQLLPSIHMGGLVIKTVLLYEVALLLYSNIRRTAARRKLLQGSNRRNFSVYNKYWEHMIC